jgi:hypothetical protein
MGRDLTPGNISHVMGSLNRLPTYSARGQRGPHLRYPAADEDGKAADHDDSYPGTRIYISDISQREPFGRAQVECFNGICLTTAMVEPTALIHQDILME